MYTLRNIKNNLMGKSGYYISRERFQKSRDNLAQFGSHVIMEDRPWHGNNLRNASHPEGILEIAGETLYADPNEGDPQIDTLIYHDVKHHPHYAGTAEAGYMQLRSGTYKNIKTENVRDISVGKLFDDDAPEKVYAQNIEIYGETEHIRINRVDGLKTIWIDTLEGVKSAYLDINETVVSTNPDIQFLRFAGRKGKMETVLTDGKNAIWGHAAGSVEEVLATVTEDIKNTEEELRQNSEEILSLQNAYQQIGILLAPSGQKATLA